MFGKFLSKNHNKSMMPNKRNISKFSLSPCVCFVFYLDIFSPEKYLLSSLFGKLHGWFLLFAYVWNCPIHCMCVCVYKCIRLLFVHVMWYFICMFIQYLNPHLKNQLNILEKTLYTAFSTMLEICLPLSFAPTILLVSVCFFLCYCWEQHRKKGCCFLPQKMDV